MRTANIHSDSIKSLLKNNKIATLDEIKRALGTQASATVFRKLGELEYVTSYSHGGRFYTLKTLARFDPQGLWSYEAVWFSRYGTLLATLEYVIAQSQQGLYANQLKDMLHVDVSASLVKLFKQNKISREKLLGRYLYLSADPDTGRKQFAKRQSTLAEQGGTRSLLLRDDWVSDEIKAAIILFVSLLDEQQRRLFAGLESMQFGHGGDTRMAGLLGLDPHTVAKGRRQLLEREILSEHIRTPGAGRRGVKKTIKTSSKK